jgi:hypothetical protein
MYELYLAALSEHLALPLPGWFRHPIRPDNWEAGPWKNNTIGVKPPEHF